MRQNCRSGIRQFFHAGQKCRTYISPNSNAFEEYLSLFSVKYTAFFLLRFTFRIKNDRIVAALESPQRNATNLSHSKKPVNTGYFLDIQSFPATFLSLPQSSPSRKDIKTTGKARYCSIFKVGTTDARYSAIPKRYYSCPPVLQRYISSTAGLPRFAFVHYLLTLHLQGRRDQMHSQCLLSRYCEWSLGKGTPSATLKRYGGECTSHIFSRPSCFGCTQLRKLLLELHPW